MTQSLIDKQKDIEVLCRRLAVEPAIGVDTEFLRVRTYYPKLALVQVSTPGEMYCIDPLAPGLRLDPLWSLMTEAGVVKVMHAARQDIEVLLHTADFIPGPLFDTQIAAALLGHDEQLGYAANDVRYLLPLYERMRASLQSAGRLDWATEDFERLRRPALYETDPEQAFQRVARGVHLEADAQHILQRLCAWREITARERDLPRSWVVDDQALVEVALAAPRSRAQLISIGALRSRAVSQYGGDIVACVEGFQPGAEALWSRPESLTVEQKALKGVLVGIVKRHAAALGIGEAVLVTRGDLTRIARGTPPDKVVGGWRWQEMGQELAAAAAGPDPGERCRAGA